MSQSLVLERPLSVMERSCWHLNEVAGHNGQVIAEIEGRLEAEQVREALGHLASRHPLLRVRIARGPGRAVFQASKVATIPLQVLDTPAEKWVEAAERELNRPVPWQTGPLACCQLLRHSGSSSRVLITFLHAIGDGFSGYILMKDFLRRVADLETSFPNQAPSALPASLYDLLPRKVKGFRGFLERLRMLGRESAGYAYAGGLPRSLNFDSRPPCADRYTRLVPLRFDKPFTERLVSRARRENTSVHGAICAAGLLAVSRVMTDGQPRVLACTSAVDMRRRLHPPVGEQMGLYVSALWSVHKVWRDQPFWVLGRRIREDLGGKISQGDPFRVVSGGGLLLSLLERIPGRNRSERIAKVAETAMFNFKGTGVSNVGVLDMPDRYGEVTVRSVSFSGSLVNLGYFLAVVNTFNGDLHVNYVYNEPLITRSRALHLVETAESMLVKNVD